MAGNTLEFVDIEIKQARIREIIQEYNDSNIWNVDESADMKNEKERITTTSYISRDGKFPFHHYFWCELFP